MQTTPTATAQLPLFDLGPVTAPSSDRQAAIVTGIREKVREEDFRDADDLHTADFEEA